MERNLIFIFLLQYIPSNLLGKEVAQDFKLLSRIQPEDYRYLLPAKYTPIPFIYQTPAAPTAPLHCPSPPLVHHPDPSGIPADPVYIKQMNELLEEIKFSPCYNDNNEWSEAAFLWKTKDFYDNINNFTISGIIGPCSEPMKLDSVRDIDETFRSISTRIKNELQGKISDKSEFLATALKFRNHPNMHGDIFIHALHASLEGDKNSTNPFQAFDDFPINQRLKTAVMSWHQGRSVVGRDNTPFDVTEYVRGVSDDDENMLVYFREDLQLNQHHAAWHATHDFDASEDCINSWNSNPNASCFEDKRGELFSFFHRQLLARYDTERITHCLKPATPFKLKLNGQVDTSYNPNIMESDLKENWRARPKNAKLPAYLSYYNESNGICDIKQFWLNETISHIQNMQLLVENGNHISHDTMGNTIEASSSKSINYQAYGSIHNQGHRFIGRSIHSGMRGSSYGGVMEDFFTAMRDPIFYRWHTFVDQLLTKHKNSLPPYNPLTGSYPLRFDAVTVESVNVSPDGYIPNPKTNNELFTFFILRKFQFPTAIFLQKCPSWGSRDRFFGSTHLQLGLQHLHHFDFHYEITLKNNYPGNNRMVTIRIFLAPLEDENGTRLTLKDQRRYIMVMDIFNVRLHNRPYTTIIRDSTKSDLVRNRMAGRVCGFPNHLLLPKGTIDGKKFQLVVFVTDAGKYQTHYDIHENNEIGRCPAPGFGWLNESKRASIMCGNHGSKSYYPERDLPMGYPFDRDTIQEVRSLEEFKAKGGLGNMFVQTVTITHFPKLRQLAFRSLTYENVTHRSSCDTGRPITTPALPALTACYYDHNWTRHCHVPPQNYKCYMDNNYGKICHPQTTTTTPTTTSTPSRFECFYDQSWVRHCHAPPPKHRCYMDVNWGKICYPETVTITTPAPTPATNSECFYDQNWQRHCHLPPPWATCRIQYGYKSCFLHSTTTSAPSTAYCHYGQNNVYHCH